MKIKKMTLFAGHTITDAAVGQYFRILSGEEPVKVTFNFSNGRSKSTRWLVGLGALIEEPFATVQIESQVDQVIEFAYSMERIDDSRLTGDVDVNGLLQVFNSGGSTRDIAKLVVPANVPTMILDTVLPGERLSAIIDFDCAGYIGVDNGVGVVTGKAIPKGASINDNNTAELWFISATGGSLTITRGTK